ncbi:MAG: M56 family metallopeptidase [Bacteroidales bacterium]|nr:M56 family metallopeptidase [Bacteroidales bacterium]
MEWFITYSIKASLLTTIFFGVYHLIMKGDTHFRLHRYYLVSTALLSYLLPLIPLSFSGGASDTLQQGVLLQTVNVTAGSIAKVGEGYPGLWMVIMTIYLIPVVMLTFKMISGILRVQRLFTNPGQFPTSVALSPFSFFGRIFISPEISDSKKQKVLAHEMVHVKQLHSIDVIFFELLSIWQWFNPVLWLYRSSIREVHEYLADEGALKQTEETEAYKQLLFELCTGATIHSIPNSFNNSLIKKRLIMMKTPKSGFWSVMKPAVAIPFVALLLFVFACGNKTTENKSSGSSSPSTNQQNETTGQEVYTFENVDEQPVFGDTEDALMMFVAKNTKYPPEAKENGIQGRVFVSFVIDEKGKVTDAAIQKGANEMLDAEALRVVNSLPAWKPAQKGGKAVKVSFVLPINFKLQ